MDTERKFQVSSGYLLDFEQLARVLNFLFENRNAKKIDRKSLQEFSGLSEAHVASLISFGSAMGLIIPMYQILSPVGLLIAEHDNFIEKSGSLEWCHYVGSASFRNLFWYEIFNRQLIEATHMKKKEIQNRFRDDLAGNYSTNSLRKNVCKEVRFVIDAYMNRNFKKLEILHKSLDEHFYLRRYTRFSPLVFSAMIYDFCTKKKIELFQIDELTVTCGSPAVVFGLDADSLREHIEGVHERGWLRYETTYNLDQVRLKPGFSALDFLTAYFQGCEPDQITVQTL